jgi:hypothetical protein
VKTLLEALTATPKNKRQLAEDMGVSTRVVELEVDSRRGVPVCAATTATGCEPIPDGVSESESVRRERLEFERRYERASLDERERLIEEWAKRDRESRRKGRAS